LRILADKPAHASIIQVEVRDTGLGIREDLMATIFEPFVTSKERGTGLGLAISQRIVESHGGTIRAANLPHGGATFLVTLPASPISSAIEPARTTAPALAGSP
jgi:signal transduction histidine kinase